MSVVKSVFAESTDSFGGLPSSGSYSSGGVGNVFAKDPLPATPDAANRRTTVADLAKRAANAVKSAGDGANIEGGRHFIFPRNATIVTCSSWEYQRLTGIRLFANPQEATWNIKRRGTIVKTAAGHVRNTWRNKYRYYGTPTYFDEFEVSFRFQSGNITPSAGIYGITANTRPEQLGELMSNAQPPPGLQNFYEFLSLLDQPQVLGAYENRHIVIHHSRVFPTIRLEGFFMDTSPISFIESAEGGNEVVWTATMLVYRTYPRIQSATQLTDAYNKWVGSEGMGEAIGYDRVAAYKDWDAAQKRTQTPTITVAPKSSGTENKPIDYDKYLYAKGKAPNYNNPIERRNALKKLGLL